MSGSDILERVRGWWDEILLRPAWALVALAIGLGAGVGAKALTSENPSPGPSGTTSVAVVEPDRENSRADANNKPKPAPVEREREAEVPAVESGGGTQAAAAAINDYSASLDDGSSVGVAIAPLDGGVTAEAGTITSGPPWSAMKVPAAAAYLNFRREVQGTATGVETIPEGSEERSDLTSALVLSDNLGIRRPIQEMIAAEGPERAAERINAMLASGGLSLQISSEVDPSIDSLSIGTGSWSLAEAAAWFRTLQVDPACLGLSDDDRDFILSLLRQAPTELTWGAATVYDPGMIALKPGWGASDVYTTEQLVIVGNGGPEDHFGSLEGGYVVALMAQVPGSSEASFTAGQEHLAEMSQRIDNAMGSPTAPVDLTGQC